MIGNATTGEVRKLIEEQLSKKSPFQQLINPMNENKQSVVNEMDAASQRIDEISKPKKDLPAAWLQVEAANNGWIIYFRDRPGYGHSVQPDFVFNNVFDCARKIVNLLCPDKGEEELQAVQLRKLSERLMGAHGDNIRQGGEIRDLQHALDLMTAGRDQDRAESGERIQELLATQRDHEEKIAAMDSGFKAGVARLKQQRNDARAEVHALRRQITDLKATMEIRSVPTMAVVDGKVFTIDNLCKEYSAARMELAGVRKTNAYLHNRGQELIKQREDTSAHWRETTQGLGREIVELRTCLVHRNTEVEQLKAAAQGEWKRGFDAGVERVMKYVSGFCKDAAERIARFNQNPS